MNSFKNKLPIIAILFLASCSISPAIDYSDNLSQKNIFIGGFDKSNKLDKEDIEFIRINMDLIKNTSSKIEIINPSIEKYFQESTQHYSYKVGIGDILSIIVWDHPELTIPAGQFRSAGESGNVVHSDGTIFYPYIGRIDVDGLNVIQIRDIITSNLSQYIENPQVDVSVAAFRSQKAFVTGAVRSPCINYVNNTPTTIIDAINNCGGISDNADWTSVTLTRKINELSQKIEINLYEIYELGKLNQNYLIKGNDVIHVPRNDDLKVYVMGDVIKEQTMIINRYGMNLIEAINNAGGYDKLNANIRGIFVLRKNNNPNKIVNVFQLDIKNATSLIIGTEFMLEPDDVVYVTSTTSANWNRIISQIIPTLSSLYRVDQLIE